ncbi:MAG: transcription termination/antitermination protein NusA [Firmicutes bacterium]|nr:transcription termination/antitermination protein NusA [Bacillota bacterium]
MMNIYLIYQVKKEVMKMNSKEFIKALNHIVEEKNISKDVVFEAMELALATAYKKNFDSKTNVRVDIDRESGQIKVISYLVVVPEIDEGEETVDEEGNTVVIPPEVNIDAQILLEDAEKIVPGIKVGETIEREVTPKDFGRVAASTAKQVVTQKIREAERASIMNEFSDKEGEMMLGLLAMEDSRNYYVDLEKARAILPKSEMIPGETVKMGSTIKVYITKVEETTKGPLILLSRKHYGFVKRLFETEIPELVDGTVELYSVIREAGVRSKVAVYSTVDNVDAIGACIGEKGSRIASILKELNGEKVDLVLYSENPEEFIANALSPAKNVIVNIIDPEKKEALAIVPDDQNLSLAIGKKGINIKLASRLTKYKIEVKTMQQINEEGNK